MGLKVLLLCASLAVGTMVWHEIGKSQPKAEVYLPGLDLSIVRVVLDPPSGSTLKATEPITVSFGYQYTKPPMSMRVWAKVLDETHDSTYQGSTEDMTPGVGVMQRQLTLNVPGQIKTITLIGKDEVSKETFRMNLPVDYTFVRHPEVEAHARDGIGSTLALVATSPASPAVVKAGEPIEIKVAHDINIEQGLWIGVEPVTRCNMGYDGLAEAALGQGVVSTRIRIGEPCELKQVRLTLVNPSRATVFEQLANVDFKIVH